MDKTATAVKHQVKAMDVEIFEVGLFDPAAVANPMVPRTWDVDTLLRSVPWLRYQNALGRNIYVRLTRKKCCGKNGGGKNVTRYIFHE